MYVPRIYTHGTVSAQESELLYVLPSFDVRVRVCVCVCVWASLVCLYVCMQYVRTFRKS